MNTMFRTATAGALVALAVLAPKRAFTDEPENPPDTSAPAAFPGDLPSQTLDGVRLRVDMPDRWQLGQTPWAWVEAVNPGDQPRRAQPTLVVFTEQDVSPFSRVPLPAMPRIETRVPLEIELAPGETRVMRVALDRALTLPYVEGAEGERTQRLPRLLTGEFHVGFESGGADDQTADAPTDTPLMLNRVLGRGLPGPLMPTLAHFTVDVAQPFAADCEVRPAAEGVEIHARLTNRTALPMTDATITCGPVAGEARTFLRQPDGAWAAPQTAVTLAPGEALTLCWVVRGRAERVVVDARVWNLAQRFTVTIGEVPAPAPATGATPVPSAAAPTAARPDATAGLPGSARPAASAAPAAAATGTNGERPLAQALDRLASDLRRRARER